MREEGVRIYSTPKVHNNFPMNGIKKCIASINFNSNKNKLNNNKNKLNSKKNGRFSQYQMQPKKSKLIEECMKFIFSKKYMHEVH